MFYLFIFTPRLLLWIPCLQCWYKADWGKYFFGEKDEEEEGPSLGLEQNYKRCAFMPHSRFVRWLQTSWTRNLSCVQVQSKIHSSEREWNRKSFNPSRWERLNSNFELISNYTNVSNDKSSGRMCQLWIYFTVLSSDFIQSVFKSFHLFFGVLLNLTHYFGTNNITYIDLFVLFFKAQYNVIRCYVKLVFSCFAFTFEGCLIIQFA